MNSILKFLRNKREKNKLTREQSESAARYIRNRRRLLYLYDHQLSSLKLDKKLVRNWADKTKEADRKHNEYVDKLLDELLKTLDEL